MSGVLEFGRDYLQHRIATEFALARHIGIVVESAGDDGVVLSAPLAPNSNDKGTAFGGSLFSIAVLTGWAWITRYLAAARLPADTVIQDSSIRYLVPVDRALRASLAAPSAPQIEKFGKMLQRARRGRIRVEVDIRQDGILAARFEGNYASTIRTWEK